MNDIIIELLSSNNYQKVNTDSLWEVWEAGRKNLNQKVFVPRTSNTLMIYHYSETGKPVSYIELHACYNENQIKRLGLLL